MFWKKEKKSSKSNKNIVAEASIDSDNQRNSFRVTPTPDRPIFIIIKSNKVAVLDISATGLAFRASGVKVGTLLETHLMLPGLQTAIDVVIEVLRVAEGIRYCLFVQIAPQDVERIHRYILQIQKESVKKQKEFKTDDIR